MISLTNINKSYRTATVAVSYTHLDVYKRQELGLVIEVDGDYHLRPLQLIDDIEKDQILKEAGLTILRITDQEITDQITTTIEKSKV